MAEKELEYPNERFPYLKKTVYGFFFNHVKGLTYNSLPQVKNVLQIIISKLWQTTPMSICNFRASTTELRESATDNRIFEKYVYVGNPDIADKLQVKPLIQDLATLRLKGNALEEGWLADEQLLCSRLKLRLGPSSGNPKGHDTDDRFLSTAALQKVFRSLLEEALAELSNEPVEISILKEDPDLRKHFSVDLELCNAEISSFTKPPHHLIIRLIPVIQTSHHTYLLTHVNDSPYPTHYLSSSVGTEPPDDAIFTVTIMEEEEMLLREGESEGTSAVKCLQTFCFLQANHPKLSGPLLFPYLLLNCVLLIKKRKDTDGHQIWPSLVRGEEFVEVMKLLVEYLMLGRLP